MKRISLWIIILLTVFSLYVDLPGLGGSFKVFSTEVKLSDWTNKFPLKLGLDLQGGTQLVLQTDMSQIQNDQKDTALESAREVIERRVNLFGVSEAVVQSSRLGDNRRILVDLPGVKDASAGAALVGRTAQLEFREIPATRSAEATSSGVPDIFYAVPTGLTGADLESAQVTFGGNQSDGSPVVSIKFSGEGAKKFAELSKRNLGRQLPIFLDGEPITAPVVQQEILTGEAVISGQFTPESAKQLSIQLNAGALPVPISIIEQRSIGASLGQESINKSIVAGVIGIIIVMVYMAAFYGVLGLVADLALIIYTLLVLAIFKTGGFILPPVTLTLAGIAGFVLSIGMAVDANILIFERMKEERRWGKAPKQALELGFHRAWSSIKDSNISSLITAFILYMMGTGLVKGFAITLAIGVMVSMFTAVFVTRTFLKIIIR